MLNLYDLISHFSLSPQSRITTTRARDRSGQQIKYDFKFIIDDNSRDMRLVIDLLQSILNQQRSLLPTRTNPVFDISNGAVFIVHDKGLKKINVSSLGEIIALLGNLYYFTAFTPDPNGQSKTAYQWFTSLGGRFDEAPTGSGFNIMNANENRFDNLVINITFSAYASSYDVLSNPLIRQHGVLQTMHDNQFNQFLTDMLVASETIQPNTRLEQHSSTGSGIRATSFGINTNNNAGNTASQNLNYYLDIINSNTDLNLNF